MLTLMNVANVLASNSRNKFSKLSYRIARYSSFIVPKNNKTDQLTFVENDSSNGAATRSALSDLWMIPDFITPEEEQQLLEEVNPLFTKKRYTSNHWDGVITGFKEIEKSIWVRQLLPHDVDWRPSVHVLDLAADGPIDAHIDSVSAAGGHLAGLSLLSSCVMTLKRSDYSTIHMLLHPRTLYVMKGTIRYDYTHQIPANNSVWRGEVIPRNRRISIMFRDEPPSAPRDTGVKAFKLSEDGTATPIL